MESRAPELATSNSPDSSGGSAHSGGAHLLGEFARGLAYTAVQSPLEGLAQLVDHSAGAIFHSRLAEKSHDRLVRAPEESRFASAGWHAQALGAAVGMLPLVLLSRSAARSVFKSLAGEALSGLARDSGEHALTGAGYGLAFKPVENTSGLEPVNVRWSGFWGAKLITATESGASFAALAASTKILGGAAGGLTRPLSERLQQSPFLLSSLNKASAGTVGAASGLPAAVTDAGFHYSVSRLRGAAPSENPGLAAFGRNVYAYSFVGGAFALAPSAHFSEKKTAAPDTSPEENASHIASVTELLDLRSHAVERLNRSPDFARWYLDNRESLADKHFPVLSTLNIWERLSSAQRAQPAATLAGQAPAIEARFKIENLFGANSLVCAYIESLKSTWPELRQANFTASPAEGVMAWLQQGKSYHNEKIGLSPRALIEHLVEKGARAAAFTPSELSRFYEFSQIFGDNQRVMANLDRYEPGYASLASLREFLRNNLVKNKSIVEMALDKGFDGSQKQWQDLRTGAELGEKLHLSVRGQANLFDMQKGGLDAGTLSKYLFGGDDRASAVRKIIENNDDLRFLDRRRLLDGINIGHLTGFSPAELNRLEQLQRDGLSLARLRYHLADRPENTAAVQALVERGADARALDNFLRLSFLPGDVAMTVVEKAARSDLSIPAIEAAATDWRSGRDFIRDFSRYFGRGLDPALEPATAGRTQGSTSYLENHSVLETGKNFGPDNAAAKTFAGAARAIAETIPTGTPLVLLGRDAWPLLPLLRAGGHEAHYFIWSRLQKYDPLTPKQWLKEIPPGAAVIDTGFSGTVLDMIREIDPTARGYLLSSAYPQKYPTLLPDLDHKQQVDRLEALPKLIHRTQRHNPNGAAIARPLAAAADSDTVSGDHQQSRWYVEWRNRQLLRAMGLGDWEVFRYSKFSGLTPRERLGLQSQAQVEAHYRRNALLRAAHQSGQTGL